MHFAKQKSKEFKDITEDEVHKGNYAFVDEVTRLRSAHAARRTKRQCEMMEEIDDLYYKIGTRRRERDSVEKRSLNNKNKRHRAKNVATTIENPTDDPAFQWMKLLREDVYRSNIVVENLKQRSRENAVNDIISDVEHIVDGNLMIAGSGGLVEISGVYPLPLSVSDGDMNENEVSSYSGDGNEEKSCVSDFSI
mmetsp:Transcript_41461/g.48345  ORF Transcript_41461/g.48345 Transcript_41461/m.48345 type:complete len:194 (+) Transcript_41461:2765-3346(+)